MDNNTATAGQFTVVAMSPDAGKGGEVGLVIAAAVRVVPESYRHGRKAGAADQLPFFTHQQRPGTVNKVHIHAQSTALQLAPVHRQERAAQGKTGENIGAARDRRQPNIGFDISKDIIITAVQQW